MVGRSVSQEPTMADAVSYIESVKEEFHDEPAKFDEFKMRLNEVRDDRYVLLCLVLVLNSTASLHNKTSILSNFFSDVVSSLCRVEKDRITARINELISGNPKLHLGSKIFFPEAEITIPPKVEQRHESVDAKKKRANRENHRKKKLKCLDSLVFPPMTKKIDEGKKSVKKVHKKFLVLSKVDRTIPPNANKELRKSRTMFGKSVPLEKTLDDARSYIDSVKEAFHDEPAKYAEFLKLLNDYKARRLDADSVIARVDELTKDHRNLLLGLRAILLPAAKSTIPHKAKVYITKFSDLQTRFQRIDTHVVGSFHSIMTMYKEGKKSRKEVHEEVCDLLYYHEDLRADFTRIFPKLGSFRINISTSILFQ
ncbi:unnamed protein product [Arabidopsis thaliana]|uniref:(thale cress) hypothetical protein n=1 Tax=Arabidopsis thaliana TaxID=3702 RepID=A0A7G2DXV3_ARATH|nr:unnamed protein product [Arabidopsis thaliana]